MKKECLTDRDIKSDLLAREKSKTKRKLRLSVLSVIYILVISATVGLLTFIWIGVLAALLALIPSVILIRDIRRASARKQAVLNGEYRVICEKFSHIATDHVYEPRLLRRSAMREVTFLYFGSKRWTADWLNYTWSKDFELSCEGLINTSIEGDEFYLVCFLDDHEIGCAYPKKFFEYNSP